MSTSDKGAERSNGPAGLRLENEQPPSLKGGVNGIVKFLALIFVVIVLGTFPWKSIVPSSAVDGWNRGRAMSEAARPPQPPTREQIIASSSDVGQVAKALAGDASTKTRATMEGGRILVTIDLDPIGFVWTSRLMYWDHAKTIVPALFAKFSDAQVVRITAEATMVDLRGNQSKGAVAWMEFTRRDAAGINWGNVLRQNLPRVATDQWAIRAFTE